MVSRIDTPLDIRLNAGASFNDSGDEMLRQVIGMLVINQCNLGCISSVVAVLPLLCDLPNCCFVLGSATV